MYVLDLLKLIGIISSFIVLIIIFLSTLNSVCFNLPQLLISSFLLVYSMIVEVLSLIK